MASLEFTTNLRLIDGSARTTVPTPEELPLGYMCFGIVNSRASIWGNYDGSVHDLVEEGGSLNIENGTGDVLIQTKDQNQSFKVMTDGRAKVQSAPVDDDDVVRKADLANIGGGADGKTPIFKIEAGYLYNSYDNGTTWYSLGKVKGEQGLQGETGLSALVYNGQVTSDTVLSVDSTKLLYQPNFSRLPIVGDFTTFTLLVNDTDIYNVVAEITTINTSRPPSTAKVYCKATVRYINKLNANLPSVTTADEGKFLRVNASGVWVAETVPSAEGGEF